MSAAALELSRITRRFGEVIALDEVSITVSSGRMHALLGENGAGKSTLMHVAYGLTRPDAGVIRVDGSERKLASPADAIESRIGLVRQHPTVVEALTVLESVQLGKRGRFDRPRHAADLRSLGAELGMSLNPETMVGELSVADQQRLEILRAVSRGARTLILDEPTAILAPRDAAALLAWLRAFASKGAAVIYITHRITEALDFADDITVLRAGRVVLQSDRELVSRDQVARAMLGEATMGQTDAEEGPPHPGSITDISRPDSEDLRGAAAASVNVISVEGSVASCRELRLIRPDGSIAIRSAALDVRAGEVLGVAGLEGSGHHELLSVLAGRRKPDGGGVRVPNRVGYVPEDRHRHAAILDFTLIENLAIRGAGTLRGRVPWSALQERCGRLIGAFDVRASGPRARLATLSGGNQQKLVVARELESAPALLVLENPTRGLDLRASAAVRRHIASARQRGAAVVMYTSDLDELIAVADRVIVIRGGEATPAALDRVSIGRAMIGES